MRVHVRSRDAELLLAQPTELHAIFNSQSLLSIPTKPT